MIAKTCPRIVDNEQEMGLEESRRSVCVIKQKIIRLGYLTCCVQSCMSTDIYIYIHTVMQIDTDAISDHCMRIEGRIHIGQFC